MSARDRLERYVAGVLDGSILAGKLQILACERHVRDLKSGVYVFDDDELEHVVEFFSMLRHWKGKWAGEPFELEDWQVFVVGSILCWKEPTTWLRRIREAYIEIPRKNGKTFLAAGIGLYLFLADGEPGADVYTAATKRDQAKIAHEDAKRVVTSCALLRNRCPVLKDNISDPINGGKYEPLGKDANSLDGLNPHCALVDEFHAHPSGELYDVIKTGMGAREQPLLFIITTAGFLLEGPCKRRHDMGADVLAGNLEDDELFVFIACPDDGDDWRDEDTWRKANPNYGVSVNPQDIKRACKSAGQFKDDLNGFLTKRLNLWVGQETRWLDMDNWKVCHDAELEPVQGREAFGGLDLSSTTDITSCVWVVPDDEGWFYDVLARFWVPTDSAIKREKQDRVPYRQWADAGWVELTEGGALDYARVKSVIMEDSLLFDVNSIGFDPWNSSQIATDLMDNGIQMFKHPQSMTHMTEGTKFLERLVTQGRLRIGGNPVLRWMAANVGVDVDNNGNIKPSKKRAGKSDNGNKIDGIVALVLAVSRAAFSDDGPSVYEGRGMTVL